MTQTQSSNVAQQLELLAEAVPEVSEQPPIGDDPTTEIGAAGLTWGNVRAYIRLWGFDADEYFDIDAESRGNRETFHATPVWDKHTRAVSIYWKVGTNEGYYVFVEEVVRKRGEKFPTRIGRLVGKFWDSARAAEVVATLQFLINQHEGSGTSDLFGQRLPIIFKNVPHRPVMDAGHLETMLWRCLPSMSRVLFYSRASGHAFVLTLATRPYWLRVDESGPVRLDPFMVPDDLLFNRMLATGEGTPINKGRQVNPAATEDEEDYHLLVGLAKLLRPHTPGAALVVVVDKACYRIKEAHVYHDRVELLAYDKDHHPLPDDTRLTFTKYHALLSAVIQGAAR